LNEKINPENERLKCAYLASLKEAGWLSEDSVDQAAAAIDRFGAYNRQRCFKAFHMQQAMNPVGDANNFRALRISIKFPVQSESRLHV
jgi:hypothetical protein